MVVYEVTKASGEKVYRRTGSQTNYSSKAEAETPYRKTSSSSSGVQKYQTGSGKSVSVGTETIGGKDYAVIVGSPEAIEEVAPSRKVRKYSTGSGKIVSVGDESIGGKNVQVVVGSPSAINEISLKRSSSPSSFGVYDKTTQQSRMSNPFETAIVSQSLNQNQVSYVPGKEPLKQDVNVLLRDPNVKKIFFNLNQEDGVDPVLTFNKPVQPLPMYRMAEPKKGVGVEGFFNVSNEKFLDVSEFGSNIKSKGGEIYNWALDPQFEVQNPNQVSRTLKGSGLLLLGGGVSFVGGVVAGVTMPFRHPIETAKGFKELALHPISSGTQIVEDFASNPFGTAGEFYGFGKGMKLVAKGSPVKFEYENFGEGGSKAVGVTIGYEAFGRKAIPIGTINPGFYEGGIFGDIKEFKEVANDRFMVGEGFVQPKTLIGTEVFKLKIGEILTESSDMLVEGKSISPELQQRYAKLGIDSMYDLRNVESKFFTTDTLYKQGTKFLTPKEATAVQKTSGKLGGKGFGSFFTMPQVEPSLRRMIGDIEYKFDITSESNLADITKQNLVALKKAGPQSIFRITPEEPFHIEKKVRGQFQKVAEFKGEGIGEGDVAPAYAFGFDVWSNRDFMKVDKNLMAMLRGELKRKTAGSIMVKDRALGVAHEGRFKDPVDLFKITESLEKSKFGGSKKAKSFLSLAEELGIDYKNAPGDIKFEILEKKLFDMKSPSLSNLDFNPSFKSPSVRSSRRGSPSVMSPDFSPSVMSPDFSPSVASPKFSPDFSPSVMSPGSPFSPSPRSPKSPKSPSPQSPFSPSPSVRSPKSPSVFSPSVFSPKVVSPKIPMYMVPKMNQSDLYGFKPVKSNEGLAYIPDFTAKVLGLRFKPQTKAQLKKLLRQQSSGLELARFGVNI